MHWLAPTAFYFIFKVLWKFKELIDGVATLRSDTDGVSRHEPLASQHTAEASQHEQQASQRRAEASQRGPRGGSRAAERPGWGWSWGWGRGRGATPAVVSQLTQCWWYYAALTSNSTTDFIFIVLRWNWATHCNTGLYIFSIQGVVLTRNPSPSLSDNLSLSLKVLIVLK